MEETSPPLAIMNDPFPLACPPQLAQRIKPLASKLGLSTLPNHIHELAFAYLLYEALFRIISPLLSSLLAPKLYGSFTRRGKINWNAHTTSQVQAFLINTLALWIISTDPLRTKQSPPDAWRERLWGYSGAAGLAQACAAGYFLWDVTTSTLHMDVMGASSLAHAAAALAITLLGFRPFANYYGLNFVLYELSTPFLNVHWFLDKLGMTGSAFQWVNGMLLLATFGGSRLVWGSWQSWRIYQDVWMAWTDRTPYELKCKAYRAVMERGLGLSVPVECRVLPWWLGALYVGGNTLLSVLNFYWYYKMILAVRKRFEPRGTEGDGKVWQNEIDAAMGSKEHDE